MVRGFPSLLLREKSISDGRLEVQFVGSRDGVAWHRYDRRPTWCPASWARKTATWCSWHGMAVRGDEIWQYGVGLRSRHGDMADRKRQTDGVIIRYVQRVDGFVALEFDLEGGRAVTAPVKIDGSRLVLNLDTGALGGLRVGLLDGSGQPVPGLTADECDPLHTNATAARFPGKAARPFGPRWPGGATRLLGDPRQAVWLPFRHSAVTAPPFPRRRGRSRRRASVCRIIATIDSTGPSRVEVRGLGRAAGK